MVGADLGCVVDGQMWWHLFPVVALSLDDVPGGSTGAPGLIM